MSQQADDGIHSEAGAFLCAALEQQGIDFPQVRTAEAVDQAAVLLRFMRLIETHCARSVRQDRP